MARASVVKLAGLVAAATQALKVRSDGPPAARWAAQKADWVRPEFKNSRTYLERVARSVMVTSRLPPGNERLPLALRAGSRPRAHQSRLRRQPDATKAGLVES